LPHPPRPPQTRRRTELRQSLTCHLIWVAWAAVPRCPCCLIGNMKRETTSFAQAPSINLLASRFTFHVSRFHLQSTFISRSSTSPHSISPSSPSHPPL